MDSLFVFRGVFNIVYKYSADQAEGQEIKDYDNVMPIAEKVMLRAGCI